MICSLIKKSIIVYRSWCGALKDDDRGGGGDEDDGGDGDEDVSIRCNTAISSVWDKRENLLK